MDDEIYVLEACALIAFFNDEPGAEKLAVLLERADRHEVIILMSVVNLYEVYYDSLRSGGQSTASALLSDVDELAIEIVRECSDELLEQAAFFKVGETVSLADSFALGLAKLKNGKLVSTDHPLSHADLLFHPILEVLSELPQFGFNDDVAIRLTGIELEIVLVIIFGLVEIRKGNNLGHDAIRP